MAVNAVKISNTGDCLTPSASLLGRSGADAIQVSQWPSLEIIEQQLPPARLQASTSQISESSTPLATTLPSAALTDVYGNRPSFTFVPTTWDVEELGSDSGSDSIEEVPSV